jgi:NADH-quinone oxidoreductase subunit C
MESDLFAGLDLLLDAHPKPPASGLARSVFLPAETLAAAVDRLFEAGYHLEDLSGLDCAEGILVNYHFNHYDRFDRIALRVLASHEDGRVPSIASVFGGAEWHERELNDFFGVTFEGNPNPAPLLLATDDGSRPLRKSPKARRPVRELIDLGTIAYQAPEFDLFHPEEQPAESAPPAQATDGEGA